jgi:hypothetical protein
MPFDLHYICQSELNYTDLGGDTFRTGNWVLGKFLSARVVGERIFLHRSQTEDAWMGGTVVEVHGAPSPEENRKYFICHRNIDYDVVCPTPWAQSKAVARWNDDRSKLITPREFINAMRRE